MKRKKKGLSPLTRVLLCSWCVLMLVLTYFVIDWALNLSAPEGPGKQEDTDVFVELTSGVSPTVSTAPDEVTPTVAPYPEAEFVTERMHSGEAEEYFAYEDGVAYGFRYPAHEDEAIAEAIGLAANELLMEEISELSQEDGAEKILLIDYEDGETPGLYSVLFYIETEIDGVKTIETKPCLYNKKKSEFVDTETLFANLAYKYVGEQVNLLLAEQESASGETADTAGASEADASSNSEESLIPVKPNGPFAGTREEFPEYVLTAEGVRFYYEIEGERQSVTIPYIALHTYMAVTENGTVVMDGIRELDPDKPMIALTFDDGPHYQQTPRLLEILEKHGVKSTFFILGDRTLWGPSNEKALKMVYEEGHEVASHTHSHKNLKQLSVEEMTEEIVNAREAIYSVIGEYPVFIRPPYGAYNDLVKEYCYAPLITWNLDSQDWDFRNTEQVVEHVLAEAGDGKIVLMHDIHWFTVDAVEILLPELERRGYQVVTVGELLYYKNVELENGRVYHSSYN